MIGIPLRDCFRNEFIYRKTCVTDIARRIINLNVAGLFVFLTYICCDKRQARTLTYLYIQAESSRMTTL